MAFRLIACAASAVSIGFVGGCTSPLESTRVGTPSADRSLRLDAEDNPRSVFRAESDGENAAPVLGPGASADEFVRYALY